MSNVPKPTFYLHVWQDREDEPLFTEIDYADFNSMSHHDDGRIYTYIGNYAIVTVFSSITYYTRQQCLQMATSFMRGWYVRYDVNLDKCIVLTSEGVDKTHPPY